MLVLCVNALFVGCDAQLSAVLPGGLYKGNKTKVLPFTSDQSNS